MKPKSRFLNAIVAAVKAHEPEMPWKRVTSHSVRVVRRLAERS